MVNPTTSGYFLNLATLIVPEQEYSLGRSILQNQPLLPYNSIEILTVWIKTMMCWYQWCPAVSIPTFLWNVCGWMWDIKHVIKWSGQSSICPSLTSLTQLLLGWRFLKLCHEQTDSALLPAALSPSALACCLCRQLGHWYQWHSSDFPSDLPGCAQLLVSLPFIRGSSNTGSYNHTPQALPCVAVVV